MQAARAEVELRTRNTGRKAAPFVAQGRPQPNHTGRRNTGGGEIDYQ